MQTSVKSPLATIIMTYHSITSDFQTSGLRSKTFQCICIISTSCVKFNEIHVMFQQPSSAINCNVSLIGKSISCLPLDTLSLHVSVPAASLSMSLQQQQQHGVFLQLTSSLVTVLNSFLPHGAAMLCAVLGAVTLSICLSLRPSVTRVLCDKPKQSIADILISHERAITLVC